MQAHCEFLAILSGLSVGLLSGLTSHAMANSVFIIKFIFSSSLFAAIHIRFNEDYKHLVVTDLTDVHKKQLSSVRCSLINLSQIHQKSSRRSLRLESIGIG